MTIEAAAAMGFKRQDAEPSLAILEAMQAPEGSFEVAMDLARFLKVPLVDATWALMSPKRLRRYGFMFAIASNVTIPEAVDGIRPVVAGQAKAYTTTWFGMGEVREATGRTLGHAFETSLRQAAERIFGR